MRFHVFQIVSIFADVAMRRRARFFFSLWVSPVLVRIVRSMRSTFRSDADSSVNVAAETLGTMRAKEIQSKKNTRNNIYLIDKKLKPALQLQHSIVYSSFCNEICMGSSLYDTTSLEYYNIICLAYCLESVCYDDHSTISEQLIECYGDRLF